MPLTVTLSRVWAAICAAIVLALVIALAVQTVRIEGFRVWPLSHKGLKAQRDEAVDGRKADRSAYEAAQAKAKADNLEHVRKIETEQKVINDEVTRDLNARLERLRSELRRHPAAGGSSGGPGVSQTGNQPGAPEEAGVCLTPEELLRGAENEERHDQLITLVERLIAGQR
jgi:hypothetical protein